VWGDGQMRAVPWASSPHQAAVQRLPCFQGAHDPLRERPSHCASRVARFGSVSSARKRKHQEVLIHSHSTLPLHIAASQSARARVATITITLERVFSAQNIQHPLSPFCIGPMLLLSLRLVCANECQSDLGQLPSLPHQPRTVTPQDQLPNLVQGLKEASVGVRNHDLTVSSSCNHLVL
jgi:hypothetical protein